MSRIEKLRSKLRDHEIDGLLVTSTYNRQYLTNFTGTAGVAIISEQKAIFITDFRYVEQAKEQATGFEIVQHTGPIFEEVAKQVAKLGLKQLGFEQSHLTYEAHQTYAKAIETASLVPISGLVEDLRLIKDTQEIKMIQDAADIADAAFTHILTFIKPGVTELAVSNELEFFMRKQGATSSSFDIIVASGYRSALPHGVASEKVIEKGELVTLDFGAYLKGYCSDITRTIAVGEVSSELKTIYNTVLEAQLLGMKGIRPGITGKQADALTRDYITEKGYGEYFGHSTGHGLGMEVHEGPGLSMKSNTVLAPGMVVTVEPGIYIAGVGGTRIEDDTLITPEGNKTFTHSTKELLIVGE
ncbi:M24 family metallopeptidase [Halalkalibacter akibai]|uniref:Aminopeptidase YpdF n=1 Tax=Halalkalibacter akibai (strain ATCC 43226 / DSM 21942 / CIP 109018 / JCM 9157 / 1139) TaxID=1236973 RepID=W4QXF9_HALA3|nr:Xaa-Pro peptidase family protein [Halalkalibacter akibai]GAE36328.1 aminopeptidase YpdF [Halalkalibacter akibai JCM 9157]